MGINSKLIVIAIKLGSNKDESCLTRIDGNWQCLDLALLYCI